MKVSKVICPHREIKPSIYAYTTPTNIAKDGWVKIGYTERDADLRINEQTRTAGIRPKKLWDHEAKFVTGDYFKDYDFHNYLLRRGVKREKYTEWFYFNDHPYKSEDYFFEFVSKDYDSFQKGEKLEYELREEQKTAVKKTLKYFNKNKRGEFLWNAKPRFGKTLTSYDLMMKMNAEDVLIVTNRPAIANSWFDDFQKFISWRKYNYKFVSETESLKGRPTLTHDEFLDLLDQQLMDFNSKESYPRRIAFISLQDLKGSIYFGGEIEKLEWVAQIDWDLLIIDEAHEGVDTLKTDVAFNNIKRDYTLHLSGTPFKAIASGKFSKDQIYNWSYADEQEAKRMWDKEEYNPYAPLPQLNMLTYKMSSMIIEDVNKGTLINEKQVDYAFDLNEFFKTKDNGRFEYEEDVKKWLNTLTTNKKYPFSTPELRNKLKHTFWILDRVASAKALARLLEAHPVFENYKIIVAAGEGNYEEDEVKLKSLQRVQNAIKNNNKTITLSVGQLTTGVTIPEWSAVLMLSNMKSPEQYMQAAFRAQNPHQWVENNNGKKIVYRKENAYVFDFSPERTLLIFDIFANNLISKTSDGAGTFEERKNNVKRLLNFFPVIAEDDKGVMVELDAEKVFSIPRSIKATEVVRRGFMSNLLFANISGIFSAPQVAIDILDQLEPEQEGRIKKTSKKVNTKGIKVDHNGEVILDNSVIEQKQEAIFGPKIYEVSDIISNLKIQSESSKVIEKSIGREIAKSITKEMEINQASNKMKKLYPTLTKKCLSGIKKEIGSEIEQTVEETVANFNSLYNRKRNKYAYELNETSDSKLKEKLLSEWQKEESLLINTVKKEIANAVENTIDKTQRDITKKLESQKETKIKNNIEEDIRSRLRGFSRTIPSFLMAYGDRNLTLANFETYVPDHVFQEVTGITIEQFQFLRDGGEYFENGEKKYFEGGLFDEEVFNHSIQEFLNKKSELQNYFEEQEEDIFDYIPPQKTNQIYTPKSVVKKMVDELEKENPDIFNDPNKTFIDIYMKSGLYITEIVKKLFNSPGIIRHYPDKGERLKHILENQVYGFAPSEIIYNIAINFIFSDFGIEISQNNFKCVDTTPYVKEGKLNDLIEEHFG